MIGHSAVLWAKRLDQRVVYPLLQLMPVLADPTHTTPANGYGRDRASHACQTVERALLTLGTVTVIGVDMARNASADDPHEAD